MMEAKMICPRCLLELADGDSHDNPDDCIHDLKMMALETDNYLRSLEERLGLKPRIP